MLQQLPNTPRVLLLLLGKRSDTTDVNQDSGGMYIHIYIYIYRASATHCAGVLWCNDLPRSQTSVLGKGSSYTLARTTIEKRNVLFKGSKYGKTVSARAIKLQYQMRQHGASEKLKRETKRTGQRECNESLDEDGEVQDLAVLK